MTQSLSDIMKTVRIHSNGDTITVSFEYTLCGMRALHSNDFKSGVPLINIQKYIEGFVIGVFAKDPEQISL